MARGRPKAQLHLSTEERAQLQGVASSRALPHGLVRRVQIVLASADGEPDSATRGIDPGHGRQVAATLP
jgi:putative transposase